MCKMNRIVVFLGAGFPRPWDAPSSQELYEMVAAEIRKTSYSFLTELFPTSFEDLIAALYYCSACRFNALQQKLFEIKIPNGTNLDEATAVYRNCINIVMKAIHAYEETCKGEQHNDRTEHLLSLFRILYKRYRHISVYTTNYDEILPHILDWPDECLSLNGELFNYCPLSHRKLKYTYSSLHGSIHLEMRHFDGQQYEIRHNSFFEPLMYLHEVYGGNPGEIDMFSPIILGHNKTQQILSKHFNYVTTCFANDLSDCDTLLAIGCSFSDLHLNALIRQYTLLRDVDYRIVSLDAIAHNSKLDHNIFAHIIGYGAKYTPDTQDDPLFIREKGRLVYYKKGTDAFLQDTDFWNDYL